MRVFPKDGGAAGVRAAITVSNAHAKTHIQQIASFLVNVKTPTTEEEES